MDNKRYVINHEKAGVFGYLGFGFTTFTCQPGNELTKVTTFRTAQEADEYARQLFSGRDEHDLVSIVEVNTDKEYATEKVLRKAGLADAADALAYEAAHIANRKFDKAAKKEAENSTLEM